MYRIFSIVNGKLTRARFLVWCVQLMALIICDVSAQGVVGFIATFFQRHQIFYLLFGSTFVHNSLILLDEPLLVVCLFVFVLRCEEIIDFFFFL